MTTQGSQVQSRVHALLAELEKTAGVKVKSAEAGTEQNSAGHPTDEVDDNTQDVSTGSRAAEDTADIQSSFPASVATDAVSDIVGEDGTQDAKQPNFGTSVAAVGEDPAVEDNYKDSKDEPGSMGGGTETDLKYGTEKYGSWTREQCRAKLSEVGNRLLQKVAAAMKTAGASVKQQTTASQTAAQAGYNAAALAGFDKQASVQFLQNCQNEGERMAELTVWYLNEQLTKQAGDPEMLAAEDHSGAADTGSGANPGEAAGAAMLDAAASAPPPAMEEGQPSEDELLQAILELLAEKGISPEELSQLVAGGAGAGEAGLAAGGGMPPEATGLPPEALAAKAARAQKVAGLRNLGMKVAAFVKAGRANTPQVRTRKVAGLKLKMADALRDMLQIY